MDLSFSLAEEAFRAEVRAFMADSLCPKAAAKVRERRTLTKHDLEAYHTALNGRGWLAPQLACGIRRRRLDGRPEAHL